MYDFLTKDVTNWSIPEPEFYLFGLISAFLKTSTSFSSGRILITSLMYCMNLAPSGNISVSSSLIINVIDFSLFTSSTYGVDMSYYASFLLSGSLLSDSSYIRKPLCASLSMSYSSTISSAIYYTRLSSGFSSSDPSS